MSRWILQAGASDCIPISFERLADLLANEVIAETDLVRPEDAETWQPVDSVIGLCRAADQLRSSKNADECSTECDAEVAANSVNWPRREVPQTAGAASNVAATVVPPDADVQTAFSSPAKSISWWRVPSLCLGVGIVGWCGWSSWFASHRFPKPAHLAKTSEPFTLPWIGVVSHFEATMLAVDTVAIIVFAVWWFRSKQRVT